MRSASSCVALCLVALIPALGAGVDATGSVPLARVGSPVPDGCRAVVQDSIHARGRSGPSVALFVDREFYRPLKFEIERLADDIKRDLCATPIVMVVRASRVTPPEVRRVIQRLYRNNGLLGSLLIGDIPAAYIGDFQSQPPFPTDAFYQDLDDALWVDPDGNGIYNIATDDDGDGQYDTFYKTWTGEHNREVWSGRLLPPGAASQDDRVTQLQQYLNRNHDYRSGVRVYQRGMVYAESVRHNGSTADGEDDQATIHARATSMIDESWLFRRELGDALEFVWSDDLHEHMNQWLAGVGQPYEYGFLNVHGSAALQWFGGDNYLYGSDYQSTAPGTLLVDLASCSNGDFTSPDYLGGMVLFSGDTLAVMANTAPAMFVGEPGPNPDHRLLSLGVTLGELSLAYVLSNEASVLLGDPTLRLRARGTGPEVTYDRRIVFPAESATGLPEGYTAGATATVTNSGNTPVTIYHRITSLASLNGVRPWDAQFNFRVRDPLPFTLAPGESRALDLDFYYDGLSGPGVYRARFMLYTDSPTTPFAWVEMEKRLTP